MASLLQQSLRPGSGVGLTAGVDYFKNVGRAAKGGVNTAAPTIKAANTQAPKGTGLTITPSGGGESGFSQGVAGGGTPGAGAIGLTAEQGLAALGQTAYAGGLAAQATNDPTLGQLSAQVGRAAGVGGSVAAAANGQLGPMGATLGGYAAGPMGAVLGGLGGQAMSPGGINGVSAINSVANVSGLAPVNLGLGLATGVFGDGAVSLGDIGMNAPTGFAAYGNVGPVDAAQGGMAINNSSDPMGAFMGALGMNVSDNPAAAGAAAAGQAAATNESVTMSNGLSVAPDGGFTSPTDMGPQTDGGFSSGFGGGFGSGNADGNSGGGGASSDGGGAGTASGDASGNSEGSGGAADGSDSAGWKDGGYINQMPGITQRYMDGGQVMGGQGQGQMMMGAQPDAQQIQAQVAQIMRDPQRLQTMLARPVQLMQSGELTPDEVVTMGRVAQASMFNPALYPQLRQFVAAQGMTPLPPSFDPMVITNIIVIAQALQQMQGAQGATPAGQVPNMAQAQMQNPTGMKNGGYLQGPGTGRSDSIGTINESTGSPVKVANGEYVIPEHVVRAKGRDFFDGLLRKYTSIPKGD